MRKLIFQEFISIDGYAADKNHSTKFFEDRKYGQDSDEDMLQEMQRFDLILLGANTYKMFLEFWPTEASKGEIVADKLNSIPKVVFSSSLKEAPWGKYEPAHIVSGDAIAEIKKLKKESGKDMVLWGSISLAKEIMKENLIDEYQFRIVPVILGGGTSLFEERDELKLELVESKNYPSGLMFARYREL